MGDFDPAGLATDLDLTEMKRFREAEVSSRVMYSDITPSRAFY